MHLRGAWKTSYFYCVGCVEIILLLESSQTLQQSSSLEQPLLSLRKSNRFLGTLSILDSMKLKNILSGNRASRLHQSIVA